MFVAATASEREVGIGWKVVAKTAATFVVVAMAVATVVVATDEG